MFSLPSCLCLHCACVLRLSDESATRFLRLYTESLLVSLPTPDFSMPYNVICLACTVVAIAFGSIHNLTTRRFVLLDPSKKKGLLTRVKAIFKRSKEEKPSESQGTEAANSGKETKSEEDAEGDLAKSGEGSELRQRTQ